MTNTQVSAEKALLVTADNFLRAESDSVFTGLVAQGGFGKFFHNRVAVAPDSRIVQRPNRDTLYSTGVFDLDAGPVTITLPDAGKRFETMIFIDEDHYVHDVVYGAGTYTMTRDRIGTRYAVAAIRILVDPNDPKDVAQVAALQDTITVAQPGGPGKFEVPDWDQASHKKVRDALVILGSTIPIGATQLAQRMKLIRSGTSSSPRRDGASIPTRTPSISTSRQPKTMASRSTSST